MSRPKFAARCRETGVRFPDRGDGRNSGACMARESARRVTRRFWTERGCRRAQLLRTLGRSWERSTPWSRRRLRDSGVEWVVDCRERSAEAENALSVGLVKGSKRAASRLPRMLGRDQEHSTPWFLFDSFAPGSGVGSESQTQRFGMLAGERNEVFPLEIVFLYGKNYTLRNFRSSSVPSVVCLLHAARRISERGFDERKAGWRCSFACIRGFRQTKARQKYMSGAQRRYVLEAERSSNRSLARNDAFSRCIVTKYSWENKILYKFLNLLNFVTRYYDVKIF